MCDMNTIYAAATEFFIHNKAFFETLGAAAALGLLWGIIENWLEE